MKATAVNESRKTERPTQDLRAGELCLVAFPVDTYRMLSDEAAKQNMTLAQFLQTAIDYYLKRQG